MSTTGTILVVDDEPKLRALILVYLERAGYTVVEAGPGQTALAMTARSLPDLVVLDLGPPDRPGEDVLRWLRHDDVPVVLLTAEATVLSLP